MSPKHSIRDRVRVLIVDDSSLVRKVLSEGLGGHSRIEVIGVASNPYEARDILVRKRPDAIILDIEMPRMDGLTFLRKYMPVIPTPTIVVSNLTSSDSRAAIAALEAGAVEVVRKPRLTGDLALTTQELAEALVRVARVDAQRIQPASKPTASPSAHERWGSGHRSALVAVGASTGGVSALTWLLSRADSQGPAVVIAQHMPIGLSASFAERLNEASDMEVLEGRDGLELKPGRVILAPTNDRHMVLKRRSTSLVVGFVDGDKVCYQRPAIDTLFESVAHEVTCKKVGVLLTGMGSDGASGLHAIRRSGGRTVCQDEASSVVYGMPRAAWERGAAEEQHALQEIPSVMARLLVESRNRTTGRDPVLSHKRRTS